MRLKNVLIVTEDIERSKKFYKDLFGLEVILDNDGNVILTEGLVLQDKNIWKSFIGTEVVFKNNASELYFEERDIEEFVQEISFVNYIYFLEKDIERIGIKTTEIYNYFVQIIYEKFKQGYNIIWDIFSDDVLEILNKGKMVIPVEDVTGDIIYFGKRYSLVEVEINDNIWRKTKGRRIIRKWI